MLAQDDLKKDVAKAVVIVGLTTLTAKLVEWGVDELKSYVRVARKGKDDAEKSETKGS